MVPISTSASPPPSLPTPILWFVNYLRQGKGRCPGSVFLFNLNPPWPLNISQRLCQLEIRGRLGTSSFPGLHIGAGTVPHNKPSPGSHPPSHPHPPNFLEISVPLKQALALFPEPDRMETLSKKNMNKGITF